MLELSDVRSGYGDTTVLWGLSLKVARGEVVALVGRNGMGKTTTLRTIIGLTLARAGSIIFKGSEIRGLPPFEIARRGIGYSPEGRQLFGPLTVIQNLRIPFVNKEPDRSRWESQLARVFDLFPVLAERRRQRAGSLSGGEQQMLAIARTLIGGDDCLLLDEPTEGLAPKIVDSILETLRRLRHEGLTVLLVEQDVGRAFAVADRAYILEKGQIAASGAIMSLKQQPGLLERYLGVGAGS